MLRVRQSPKGYQLLRWSILVIGLLLPAIAWFLSARVFLQSSSTAFDWALLGLLGGVGIHYFGFRFLINWPSRIGRSNALWQYLASNYPVAKRPDSAKNLWKAIGLLGDEEVAFYIEGGGTRGGLYLNIPTLGRTLVPWSAIATIEKTKSIFEDCPGPFARIGLKEIDQVIFMTWNDQLAVYFDRA